MPGEEVMLDRYMDDGCVYVRMYVRKYACMHVFMYGYDSCMRTRIIRTVGTSSTHLNAIHENRGRGARPERKTEASVHHIWASIATRRFDKTPELIDRHVLVRPNWRRCHA